MIESLTFSFEDQTLPSYSTLLCAAKLIVQLQKDMRFDGVEITALLNHKFGAELLAGIVRTVEAITPLDKSKDWVTLND